MITAIVWPSNQSGRKRIGLPSRYCILNARRKKTGFRPWQAECVMGRTFVGAQVG
jgi:hypothetical protein